MSRYWKLVSVCVYVILLQLVHVTNTDSQVCSAWGSNRQSSNTLEVSSTSPRCAKPARMLAEGQYTSGVSARHPRQLRTWFDAEAFATGQRFTSKYFFDEFWGPIHAFLIFPAFPHITPMLMSQTSQTRLHDRIGVIWPQCCT